MTMKLQFWHFFTLIVLLSELIGKFHPKKKKKTKICEKKYGNPGE
jgi:hypothetical protein